MLGRFISSANKNLLQSRRTFSAWSELTSAPADPILGLNDAFKKESHPKKVLLGMGAYRTDEGKPYILPCVRIAEERILANNMDHEYAAITGISSFVDKSQKLAFGGDNKAYMEKRIAGGQSISGTGSLRLGLMFFEKWYPHKDIDVLLPGETWPLHRGLIDIVGLPKHKNYRWFDPVKKNLDFDGLVEDLESAKNNSLILMHVCAHNPTGVDPTKDQWNKMLEICLRKNFYCAFDSAYQGFASGDLEEDSYALKLFANNTDNIMLMQSFAKNFGLYGERAGCFSVVAGSQEEKEVVNSRIKQIARPLYSNPPIHGARIVDIILGDEELTKMWHEDLRIMSGRIAEMRAGLKAKLTGLGNEHNWDHITAQIGMFAFTGLNKDMVNELREKYAVYMTMDGRISLAGLNSHNIDYVAECFHKVTTGKSF